MSDNHQEPRAKSRRAGYSRLAQTAVQQTTLRVREMHSAIASMPFSILRRVPLLAGPARLVQAAHDTISAAVYSVIKHSSGGLFAATDLIEHRYSAASPYKPPGRFASGLRSALNGAFGDHLAAGNSRLAIDMALHADGAVLTLDDGALSAAFPDASDRLCIFVHGLGCDPYCWQPAADATASGSHFGLGLSSDLGYTPLYLSYNTGLPIEENCAQLAILVEKLLAAWPQPLNRLVVVGHSMGGLIALGACDKATAEQMEWVRVPSMIICLGSPLRGSPVERLGHLTNSVLNLSRVTLPLGKIAAARSQGVKDLRFGPGARCAGSGSHTIAFRFLGASLAENVDHPVGEFLGDGLVPLSSAIAHEIEGDVETARVGRLGHMAIVNDARVYRQIRDWVAAQDRDERLAEH